jgi:Tol biopolymer transport system component
VYLVPSTGGEARQLTYFSGDDQILYWMPDGKAILISSNRGPGPFGSPLYRLPIDGSPEAPLAMPPARLGMVKQDGSAIAFNRVPPSTASGESLKAATRRPAHRGTSPPARPSSSPTPTCATTSST